MAELKMTKAGVGRDSLVDQGNAGRYGLKWSIRHFVMENEFSAYLADLLGSSAEDNGGNVIEIIFDLKALGIETLQALKER